MTVRPQHPRAAWPSNDDMTAFYLAAILLGAGVGAYLLWTNYHTEISTAVMALRHQEILVLRHFTSRFDLADAQMRASDPSEVSFQDLYGISRAIGEAWRIPGAAAVALLAVLCLLSNPVSRFRRQFDLAALIREQMGTFPTVAAFAKRQLRLVEPAPGAPRPADYGLTAPEWIARYATAKDGSLDEQAARAALLAQLGPRWRGLTFASPQVRVMFAACALHLAERRDEALELLGACSKALTDVGCDDPAGPQAPLHLPEPLVRSVDTVLADKVGLLVSALDIADRHAWTHPALMSLLNAARRKAGVLPPAQFAWLKLVDRLLWYALHSLGFESEGIGRYLHPYPRVEAAGARDHWALERVVGRPVVTPTFELALEAMTDVLKGTDD
jgi:intracellular multiplication protein IcmP